MLQGEELYRIYASCDLFVFPSTTETYGNVVLEAMAAGLPVVAPLSGGITENLRPGINGLDFPPHDPGGWPTAICTLLQNDSLRRQMADEARRHAETRSWSNALSPVLEGYREVVPASRLLPKAGGIIQDDSFSLIRSSIIDMIETLVKTGLVICGSDCASLGCSDMPRFLKLVTNAA